MESNIIDIKTFADILCDENAPFVSYRYPFRDEKFVYANASRLLIRIAADRVRETDLPTIRLEYDMDRCEVLKEHTLYMSALRSLSMAIQEEKNRELTKADMELCYECLGSGKVLWEYSGTYRRFERNFTCPVCKGKRYIKANSEGLPKPGDYASMFGRVFYCDSLYRLYQVLEKLGVSECQVYETNHSMMRIPVNEYVTIYILCPIIIQHNEPWVRLKLNETQISK